MTNSEIKKRLPKDTYQVGFTNFEEFCEIGKRLSELYSFDVDYSRDSYDKTLAEYEENASNYNKHKYVDEKFININKAIDRYTAKKLFFYIFQPTLNIFSYHSIFIDNDIISSTDFLKYFEEDYSDEFEYIELSQYEKGLLKISINKFVQHCENFGEELLNFDLKDYGKILNKL